MPRGSAPASGWAAPAGPSDMVRDVLDALAASGPVTNETVLPLCRRWLKVTRDVVAEHDLVTTVRRPGPGHRDARVPARRVRSPTATRPGRWRAVTEPLTMVRIAK